MKKINFLWVILCILILSVGCKNGVSNSETQQTVTDPITGETVTTVPSVNQDEEGTTSDSQTDNNENPTSGESENPTLGKDEEEVTDPTIPSGSILNIDKDTLPYTQEEIYNQLFDINNKVEIDVDITNSELKKIQQDYDNYSSWGSKSPIYRKANLSITITTSKDSYTYYVEDIGIRMKGNTSRTSFYDSSEGIYNLIHFKVDFQETFSDKDYYGKDAKDWKDDDAGKKARKNRTFATLEKLEFKWNRNDDCTYIREYYAYEMYRANGVLAPHTNLTSFDIAGIHEGVFMMYEPIDEIFIEKYVDEKDRGGDLYKCGWTFNGAGFFTKSSIGVENEDTGEFYNYDLKTNKKTSDHALLKNLISVLNGNKVSKEKIAEVVDMENFLKFEAVSYFVGNPDDLRNNYNNHYIYFNKSTGKLIIIPYDMDRCFGITNGWDPTGNGMTAVSPFSQNAEGAGHSQGNPLYIKTVDEGGYYIAEYAEVLAEISNSEWLTSEHFNKFYEIARNNYKDDTKPSKTFYNAEGHMFSFNNTGAGGNLSFSEYVKAKLATYKKYAAKVDDYTSTVQPYYIRGTITGWNVSNDYKMTYNKADNTYTYNLRFNNREEFKVNNGVDGDAGDWYGYDDVTSIASHIDMSYSEGHGNIILPAGSYLVTFYPEDMTITIE